MHEVQLMKYPQNRIQTLEKLTKKLYRSSQQKEKDTALLNFCFFHEFAYMTENTLHI